jgi:hypothetical protein
MSKGELLRRLFHFADAARVHTKVHHHRLHPRRAVAFDSELSPSRARLVHCAALEETGSSATDTCPRWAVNAVHPQEPVALPRDRSDPGRRSSFLVTKLPLTHSNHPHTIHVDVLGMVRHGRERIPATTEAK